MGYRAPEVRFLKNLSQRDRRLYITPALDWWSLGCTAALLAWATLAEPGLRPKIASSSWAEPHRRDDDLLRVAPRGCPLRPVLDMLLDHDPDARSVMAVDSSLMRSGCAP